MGWNPFDAIGDLFEEVVSWFVDIPESQGGAELNRSSRNDPIPIVYGREKVKGANWAYWTTAGTKNRYLYIWVAFAEGEIDGFEEIFIDDKPLAEFKNVNRSGYPNFAPYVGDDIVVIREYYGTDDQTADAMLRSVDPRLTANFRLQGIGGLVLRLRWNDSYFSGMPQISAVIRGRKILNAAGTADEWTANGALILRDYLTNTRFGKGLDWAVDFDQPTWQAAFADCESTETFFTTQSLGQPDEVAVMGGEQVLRWDSRPDSAVSIAGARIIGSGGAEAVSRTGFMSSGHFGQPGGYYLPYDTVNGAFGPADTVTVDDTTGKLFSFNGVLNGGPEFDTILDNVRRIRAVIRGNMPSIQGKFYLYVEKARAPVATVQESDILGGINWGLPKKGDKYNKVTVKYINPSADWKEDIAIWPDPGSTEEAQFLAEDNGLPLPHEVSIEGVRNAYQARDLARIICLKSRDGVQASFTADPWLLGYHSGQVIALNWSGLGWNDKPFMITQRGLSEDGKVILGVEEHTAGIYSYEADVLDVIKDNTDHPDPFDISPPGNIVLATVGDIIEDKTPRQVNLYIDVTFDRSLDEFVRGYEIRQRTISDVSDPPNPDVRPWTYYPAVEQVDEAEASVTYYAQVFYWLRRYEVQVRSLTDAGSYSDWSPVELHDLIFDTTPPAPSVIESLVPTSNGIAVTITPTATPDYSYARIYLNTVDTFPGSPAAIEELYGSDGVIAGLTQETQYFVWATSVDDVGNESAPGPSSSTTTLASEGGTPIYSQPDPPTGAEVGAIWQRTPDLALFEWDGNNWVDHIPEDPTGLVLVNATPGTSTEFTDDEATFAWDPASLSVYLFYIEVHFNGELQDNFKTQDRGGSNAASSMTFSVDDAIKAAPVVVDGETVIEDGARDLTVRVWTMSSDNVVRSANYIELAVSNPQEGPPAGAVLVQNLNGVFAIWQRDDGTDIMGVVAYASETPGFTPDDSNRIGYFPTAEKFVNIGAYLNEDVVYYVRWGIYDKWGRDGVQLTPEESIKTAPPSFNFVFGGSTPPVYGIDAYFNEGDLWVNEGEGDNQYQWQGGGPGGAWIDVQDSGISQALFEATAAQDTADSKAKIFRADNPPLAGDVTGQYDAWFDTNDGNREYLWVGTPPAGGWVDAQDVDIQLAQSTANSAQSDANAAQGTANTALSDANNINSDQINDRQVTRVKVKTGDLVEEYQVTLGSKQYNNPANGEGANDTMGGVTFTANGTNVQVTCSVTMAVTGYANTDPEDIPRFQLLVYMDNNTTGVTTRVVAAADQGAPKVTNAALGVQNMAAICVVGSDTADPNEVGPQPGGLVNPGDSITVRVRPIYYRGTISTGATSVLFSNGYMEVVELNNT